MFEDSLFASTARPNRRCGVAAVLSFAFQALVLSVFVLLPLIYTNALPVGNLKTWIEVPQPPGRAAPQPPQPHQVAQHPTSNYVEGVMVQPHTIPLHVGHVVDPADTSSSVDEGPGVIGMPPGTGTNNRVIADIIGHAVGNAAPPAPRPSLTSVRLTSQITEGLLIRKVTPSYPKLAMIARQQGSVILEATIARDGSIENLRAVSGPPLLLGAAIDAVRQWRYRPYLLNNQPVEVETQITVNFILAQ